MLPTSLDGPTGADPRHQWRPDRSTNTSIVPSRDPRAGDTPGSARVLAGLGSMGSIVRCGCYTLGGHDGSGFPRLGGRGVSSTGLGAAGLRDDLLFWRFLFDRSNPSERFIDLFHQRARTERPLQPQLEKLLSHVRAGSVVRVLDVVSGPLTHIGTVSGRWRVEVTCVDPLADEYSALCEEFGLARRGVHYVAGEAETLAERFPGNHFHLVYCRNALDHSRDPLLGIRQMVKVLKAGGCCWLNHSTDEGEKQHYRGLHRWNFSPQHDGDLAASAPEYPRVTLRQLLGLAREIRAARRCRPSARCHSAAAR